MQKVYSYNSKEYFRKITFVGIFTAIAIVVCIYMALTADNYAGLFAVAAFVALYSSWNTFIAKVNSKEVILEEDGISFVAYGRTDKYLFSEITQFRARDFRTSGKIFIRVNNTNFFKGRYWVHTLHFTDREELYLFILQLEYKTHPDSMKARAWDSTRPNIDKSPVLPWNLPKKAGQFGAQPAPEKERDE